MCKSHLATRFIGILVLATIVALGMSGCIIPYDSDQRCDSEACDPNRWVLVAADSFFSEQVVDGEVRQPVRVRAPRLCVDYNLRSPADATPLTADPLFAADPVGAQRVGDSPPLLAFSLRPAGELTLAAVTTVGDLILAPLGAVRPDAVAMRMTVGVAWSNAGDRLAVVLRDPSLPITQAHQILILTPQLEELDRFALDLPLSDPNGNLVHDRFVVSWNSDDTLVAVSTTATCNLGACKTSTGAGGSADLMVSPRCMVVRVADGAETPLNLSDTYFVGVDQIVGTRAARAGAQPASDLAARVFVMRLRAGDVEVVRRIQGPQFVLSSHPPSGAFITADSFNAVLTSFGLPASLRTLDGRRSSISALVPLSLRAGGESFSILPADQILPAARAAGLTGNCGP